MNKKENRMSVRQAAEKAVIRDEQNRRLEYAATTSIKEALKELHTTLCGLDPEAVSVSRAQYGSNKVTHEKKKSLARRLADAFINPFTAILFFLALVSIMTDMVFPYFSLFGSVPEDFDCLTVVIILTMVIISGTLRFVQESRSGNAAEKLLAMITTTCTVTRKGQEKMEIPMDEVVVGDIVHLSAGDMIRTPKLPFIQSRASAPLTLLTLTGITVLTVIPFTPLGTVLGFVTLPAAYFAYLIPCILLYMVLATSLKKAYVRHYGELL